MSYKSLTPHRRIIRLTTEERVPLPLLAEWATQPVGVPKHHRCNVFEAVHLVMSDKGEPVMIKGLSFALFLLKGRSQGTLHPPWFVAGQVMSPSCMQAGECLRATALHSSKMLLVVCLFAFQHLISLSDDNLAPIEPINAGGDGVTVKNAGSVHNPPQNSWEGKKKEIKGKGIMTYSY